MEQLLALGISPEPYFPGMTFHVAAPAGAHRTHVLVAQPDVYDTKARGVLITRS